MSTTTSKGHPKPPKTQQHLINLVRSAHLNSPSFALFLGAGASATSRVKLASKMIEEWRLQFHRCHGRGKSFEDCIKAQIWYNKPEEYSLLFETMFDQPSQRRQYIEECLKGASPGWGYIYLVNLLRHKVFGTVFTTNFDDLINEACYRYSDEVRPIVCAHDSAIDSIRISSNRPKVVKLHGDFLFDNIKNTVRELETLEENTRNKLKQFAYEFGFIFIGYAGNDRSVMDTVSALLRTPSTFPHGVYWCVRNLDEVTTQVDLLNRFPSFSIVTIDGFDEFMAELNQELGLKLQPEMVDPYVALTQRLDQLVRDSGMNEGHGRHPIIDSDIKKLAQNINRRNSAAGASSATPPDRAVVANPIEFSLEKGIPYELLAEAAIRSGDTVLARKLLNKLLVKTTTIGVVDLATRLYDLDPNHELEAVIVDAIVRSDISYARDGTIGTELGLRLLHQKHFTLAMAILQKLDDGSATGTINHAQAYLHAGDVVPEDVKQRVVQHLLAAESRDDSIVAMCAAIVLGKYAYAEEILVSLKRILKSFDMFGWPIMRLLVDHVADSVLKEFIESSLKTASMRYEYARTSHASNSKSSYVEATADLGDEAGQKADTVDGDSA